MLKWLKTDRKQTRNGSKLNIPSPAPGSSALVFPMLAKSAVRFSVDGSTYPSHRLLTRNILFTITCLTLGTKKCVQPLCVVRNVQADGCSRWGLSQATTNTFSSAAGSGSRHRNAQERVSDGWTARYITRLSPRFLSSIVRHKRFECI